MVVVDKLFWWFLLKLVKMKLLLLIVDEIMRLCFDWCYVVLLMIIYTLGVVIGEVMIKLLLFIEFWRKWVINGELWFLMNWGEILMFLCWDKLNEFLFLIKSFGWEIVWEKIDFRVKSRFNHFCK